MNRTALIAIDYINDIADRRGRIASSADHAEARAALLKAGAALHEAVRLGWPIVGVRVGFRNDEEMPLTSPVFRRLRGLGALHIGTWGTQWHPLLGEPHFDQEFIKSRVSGFHDTLLESWLRSQGIGRLVVCGISSALAVESTVRDAHDRDFEVAVLEDACAAKDEMVHQRAMENCRIFGECLQSSDLAGWAKA